MLSHRFKRNNHRISVMRIYKYIRLCKKDDSEFVIKIYKKGREINNDLENKLLELSGGCSIVPILDKGIFKQRYYESCWIKG